MPNVYQLFHDRQQSGDEAGQCSAKHQEFFSDIFGHAYPLHVGMYSNDEEESGPEKAQKPTGC
jgi:hypothetical protein